MYSKEMLGMEWNVAFVPQLNLHFFLFCRSCSEHEFDSSCYLMSLIVILSNN